MIQHTTLDMELTDGMNRAERCVKRCFDIVVALSSLLVLSPFMLLIAIALKLKAHGPVLFRQERIGYRAHPFKILKFRTMRTDTERDGRPLLAQTDDERLIPLGRFLRTHHLDELPQLWNILVGEMSFVGPRPERRYFIDQIMAENSDYRYIFCMRPGATSKATIYNGYTDTMEKMLVRLQMDLDYYQHRSLLMDAQILWTTLKYVLFGKNF